jgi:uncharacterized membrane protein YgcG
MPCRGGPGSVTAAPPKHVSGGHKVVHGHPPHGSHPGASIAHHNAGASHSALGHGKSPGRGLCDVWVDDCIVEVPVEHIYMLKAPWFTGHNYSQMYRKFTGLRAHHELKTTDGTTEWLMLVFCSDEERLAWLSRMTVDGACPELPSALQPFPLWALDHGRTWGVPADVVDSLAACGGVWSDVSVVWRPCFVKRERHGPCSRRGVMCPTFRFLSYAAGFNVCVDHRPVRQVDGVVTGMLHPKAALIAHPDRFHAAPAFASPGADGDALSAAVAAELGCATRGCRTRGCRNNRSSSSSAGGGGAAAAGGGGGGGNAGNSGGRSAGGAGGLDAVDGAPPRNDSVVSDPLWGADYGGMPPLAPLRGPAGGTASACAWPATASRLSAAPGGGADGMDCTGSEVVCADCDAVTDSLNLMLSRRRARPPASEDVWDDLDEAAWVADGVVLALTPRQRPQSPSDIVWSPQTIPPSS